MVKRLRHELIDIGLFLGFCGALVYAGVTAHQEEANYFPTLYKQLLSIPIIPSFVTLFYFTGAIIDEAIGLADSLTQKKAKKNLEKKLK